MPNTFMDQVVNQIVDEALYSGDIAEHDMTVDGVVASDFNDFKSRLAAKLRNGDGSGNNTVPDGMSTLLLEIVDTYADINIDSDATRLIKVNVDETNNNDTSLYLHDGDEILFLLTIE